MMEYINIIDPNDIYVDVSDGDVSEVYNIASDIDENELINTCNNILPAEQVQKFKV